MKSGENAWAGMSANETAPGIRYLKQVWSISDRKSGSKTTEIPKNLSTDIYKTPAGGRSIPPRSRP